MGGVRFDQDGTAGGEGGGGIAAGDREGEGEVRAAKDRDGTERDTQATQVGQRTHGRVTRVVDRGVEERAVEHDVGEEPQLERGATELTFQSNSREGGLVHRHVDEALIVFF